MRGRPIPVGRDWMGHYLGPGSFLVNSDAEYVIGLSDYLVEFWTQPGLATTPTTYCIQITSGTNTMQAGIRPDLQKLLMYLGSTNALSDAVEDMGEMVHGMMAVDRDVAVYFHVDGSDAGKSTALTAESSTNIDSNSFSMGGVSVNNRALVQAEGRLIIFPSGVFPTEEQLDQIAAERQGNPWEESPTLLKVLGDDYDAACRVVAAFVDVDQDGTTVENHGTGGDLTIGGSLEWRDVRTQVERTAIPIPDADWRQFSGTRMASHAGADLGCSAGSYIVEVIYQDLQRSETDGYIYRIYNTGNPNEGQIYCYYTASSRQYGFGVQAGGTGYYQNIMGAGYSDYGRLGLFVVHHVYDKADGKMYTLLNNQLLEPGLVAAGDMDLSSSVALNYDKSNSKEGILAKRIWHAPGGSCPSGWRDELKRRVSRPWTAEGAFDGMTLVGNWECRIDDTIGQPATGTALKNLVNPGVGDQTIISSGTLHDSTVIAIRGAA